jgi:hypothetical protein
MAAISPVKIDFNDKPRTLAASMDALLEQEQHTQDIYKSRKRMPLSLFLLGLPFLGVDFVLDMFFGFRPCLFWTITAVLWLTAVVIFFSMLGKRGKEFPPLYRVARNIIYILRDDIAPKKSMFGHLDLTGPKQDSKLVSEIPDASGREVRRYQDEWLMFKAKLYDGNVIRLTASERLKIRKGYWKRGTISGKMKRKPEKLKSDLQYLRVQLTVNPENYEIVPNQLAEKGAQIGGYWVEEMVIDTSSQSGGIISLKAATGSREIKGGDILAALQALYSLLKRKEV